MSNMVSFNNLACAIDERVESVDKKRIKARHGVSSELVDDELFGVDERLSSLLSMARAHG